MDNPRTYLPPVADVLVLHAREHILNLSNYGAPGQPGNGFGNGNIIEKGNHETLMAMKGFYNELYTSQFALNQSERS